MPSARRRRTGGRSATCGPAAHPSSAAARAKRAHTVHVHQRRVRCRLRLLGAADAHLGRFPGGGRTATQTPYHLNGMMPSGRDLVGADRGSGGSGTAGRLTARRAPPVATSPPRAAPDLQWQRRRRRRRAHATVPVRAQSALSSGTGPASRSTDGGVDPAGLSRGLSEVAAAAASRRPLVPPAACLAAGGTRTAPPAPRRAGPTRSCPSRSATCGCPIWTRAARSAAWAAPLKRCRRRDAPRVHAQDFV